MMSCGPVPHPSMAEEGEETDNVHRRGSRTEDEGGSSKRSPGYCSEQQSTRMVSSSSQIWHGNDCDGQFNTHMEGGGGQGEFSAPRCISATTATQAPRGAGYGTEDPSLLGQGTSQHSVADTAQHESPPDMASELPSGTLWPKEALTNDPCVEPLLSGESSELSFGQPSLSSALSLCAVEALRTQTLDTFSRGSPRDSGGGSGVGGSGSGSLGGAGTQEPSSPSKSPTASPVGPDRSIFPNRLDGPPLGSPLAVTLSPATSGGSFSFSPSPRGLPDEPFISVPLECPRYAIGSPE